MAAATGCCLKKTCLWTVSALNRASAMPFPIPIFVNCGLLWCKDWNGINYWLLSSFERWGGSLFSFERQGVLKLCSFAAVKIVPFDPS